MEDHIVNEVRNAGLSILKECGNDIEKYYRYIKEKEIEEIKKGRKVLKENEDKQSVAL